MIMDSPDNHNLAALKSLHELLEASRSQTLKGKNVKIPITSKAYFEGKLDPSLNNISEGIATTDNERYTREDKEQLLINVGKECMIEMNKDEACNFIEKKVAKLRKLVGNQDETKVKNLGDRAVKKKKKDTELKMKKGFLNGGNKLSHSKKKAGIKTNAKPITVQKERYLTKNHGGAASSPMLPFMEIREEFDRDGNEIKAEALNISNELINFQRELKEKKEGIKNESRKETKSQKSEIIDALLDNLPANHEIEDTTQDVTDIGDKKLQKPSKSYEEISSRLDQLILLEEEDTKKKAENAKSSKRLRGKGWAKGFLDTSPSIKEMPKTKMKAKIENNKVNISLNKEASTVPMTTSTVERGNKTVQFKSSNEVKEIPRIGNRSIAENIIHNNIPGQPKPTRQVVSIGNIVERDQPRIAVQQRDNTELAEPQKKLSKFAQRRLQQRQS